MAKKVAVQERNPFPAISVRQPYAELILLGFKTMEFRTWNSHYRGPMLLHAPRTITEGDRSITFDLGMAPARFETLPRGAYIGVVYLADVLEFEHENVFEVYPVVEFEAPIPGKGKTNLFYPSDNEWAAIQKALAKTPFDALIEEFRVAYGE